MFDFIKKLWFQFISHLQRLEFPYKSLINEDEIQQLKNLKKNKFAWDYVFPFLLTALICIDTAYVYFFLGYDIKKLTFYHHIVFKVMPNFFLRQADVVYFGVHSLVLICAIISMLDSWLHVDFIMVKRNKRNELILPYRKAPYNIVSKTLSEKLIKSNKNFVYQLNLLRSTMISQMYLAHTIPIAITEIYKIVKTNGNYVPSLRFVIVFIVCLFYNIYIIVSIIRIVYFIYVNYMIQIKQKHYLAAMSSMNIFNDRDRNMHVRIYGNNYKKFFKFMSRTLDVTREINAFNSFYHPYVTTIAVFFGIIGCSALYAVMTKANEAPIIFMIPWIFYSAALLSIIFLFNAFSS